MKTSKLMFFGLFVFMASVVNGQHWCGTEHTEEFMQRLEANVKFANNNLHLVRKMDFDFVPIKFHLVANDDGIGRMSEENVLLQLCRLNIMYEEIGLQFYVNEGFNYVDDSAIFSPSGDSQVNTAQARMNAVAGDFEGNLNIFITNGTGTDGVAGYYSPFYDFVVIDKANLLEENSSTIGHEVGHHFTLSHPHYGWEDEPYTPEQYGEQVNITQIGSSQSPLVPVEVMNDPNCNTTGDRICDTPPDYGFTQNGGGPFTCSNPWEGFVKDRNGVLIETFSDLVMGYNSCDVIQFTQGQIDAVNADYINRVNDNQNAQRYLISGYIPDTLPIFALPDLNYPGIAETVETFNAILFDWEAVDNAHSYILILGGATEQRIQTTDTEYFVGNLEPNQTYTWKVVPVNEVGYCLQADVNNLFFTGDSTSSTEDVEGVNAFSVFPNPSMNADELSVSFDLESQMKLDIQLISSDGKLAISETNNIFNAGSSTKKIDISELSPGIYFVNLIGEKGMMTKRIVIHN